MLPTEPKNASYARLGSFLLAFILVAASMGTWTSAYSGARDGRHMPQKPKSGAKHREEQPSQATHHERPEDPYVWPQADVQLGPTRPLPGQRYPVLGDDSLFAIGLVMERSPREIEAGPRGARNQSVLYGNRHGAAAFAPGAGVLVSDDLVTDALGECSLAAYEVQVTGGGDGTGAGFGIEIAIYDACPASGGQIIPGTRHRFAAPDDGLFLLRRNLDRSVEIPHVVWLGIRFSTDQAGWVVGARPEVGFSQDHFRFPSIPRDAQFDGGLYAGFDVRLLAAGGFRGFAGVQVNVDANGQNIPGDAANEPSIAVDPNDPSRMAIVWRQFDTVTSNFRQAGRGYSSDGGQSWTFPGVLDPNVFRSDPVLDFDAEGNFYFNSLSGSFTTGVFRSTDGGMTWSPPTFAFGGDKQWMTIDRTDGIGHGHIYQSWGGVFNRSTDGGAMFEQPIQIPFGPGRGTLSVGPDGEVYIAGRATSATLAVVRSSDAQDPGAVPSFDQAGLVEIGGEIPNFGGSPNPGGLLGQPWVATDHSTGPSRGNVYVLASVFPQGPDPIDVMFTRSEDGGVTWSAPVRVNDDPPGSNAWQWFDTMSVAPNGRIDVVWNDTRVLGNPRLSELYYSFSIDQGNTWSANKQLSPVFDSRIGWPNQQKIGDYYDMVSHNSAAFLAFSATFNGEQDVYFLRIDADCNDNGIPDPTDIADGTSDDCNANVIPDECEPDADCNGNQIADICDLAQGVSSDCNNNARPDECDVADGSALDCNANVIPDACDLASGQSADCNGNNTPDDCESPADCNANGLLDICDLSGDFTGNGRVDLADYRYFRGCLTGVVPVALLPVCCYFDGAADSDVDLKDFAAFANQFTGP